MKIFTLRKVPHLLVCLVEKEHHHYCCGGEEVSAQICDRPQGKHPAGDSG